MLVGTGRRQDGRLATVGRVAWMLAPLYDRFVAPAEQACFGAWRAELLADLAGTVVEIGAGTGANVEHYPSTIDRLVLTEPDPGMRIRLLDKVERRRLEAGGGPGSVEVRADGGASLPMGDGEADVAVGTLVLCTVADPAAVLAEVHRVLRPGGRFVFLEHVAAEDRPDRLRWQQRVDPVWHRVMGGCRLTRRTADTIEAAGFELVEVTRESARKTTPLVRPTIRGHAIRR